MVKIRRCRFILFLFISVLAVSGCKDPAYPYDRNTPENTVIFRSITADGSAGVTTAKLTLDFDRDIPDLGPDDITLTSDTGAETGELVKVDGKTGEYELSVFNITRPGPLWAAVSKEGYTISPANRNVNVFCAGYVNFMALKADGSSTLTTSTLTLTFDNDIPGFNLEDIHLTSDTGATGDSLIKTDEKTGEYRLTLSGINQSGRVTVTLNKNGYIFDPGNLSIDVFHYHALGTEAAVFRSISADGSPDSTTTTLTLAFDKDISGLTLADIELTSDIGVTGLQLAKTEEITGEYKLTLSGITSRGTLTVTVKRDGYTITPASRNIIVYYVEFAVFSSLAANGSPSLTTTTLTLEFDRDINGLANTDITLTSATGATRGALNKRAESTGIYELTVSGINISGTVLVSVNKDGYIFNPSGMYVEVYYVETITFRSVIANGSAVLTTTLLTLEFSGDIGALAVTDINLAAGSTGAGIVSMNKPPLTFGVYELVLTGITSRGTVTISVSKAGYAINPSSRDVEVNYVEYADFDDIIADGSETSTTTALTLTFNKDINDLAIDDITLTSNTGAAKETLARTEVGVYVLTVSSINQSGTVIVTVNKSGYIITPPSLSADVKYAIPVAFSSLEANGSLTAITTTLTLTFDRDIVDLNLGDITFAHGSTGAILNALSVTGNGKYVLSLSDVEQSGTVTLAVSKDGYSISPASLSVYIYYAIPVTFKSLNANGSAVSVTTELDLIFDMDIPYFSLNDITLTSDTGITMDGLVKVLEKPGEYKLDVSGIERGGIVTVAVSKDDYQITPAGRDVYVYHLTGAILEVTLWIDEEDGQILSSDNNFTIYRSGIENPWSFTAAVNSNYTNITWLMLGYELGREPSITIHAADYAPGNYRLDVIVFKNSIPYSTQIRFTVTG